MTPTYDQAADFMSEGSANEHPLQKTASLATVKTKFRLQDSRKETLLLGILSQADSITYRASRLLRHTTLWFQTMINKCHQAVRTKPFVIASKHDLHSPCAFTQRTRISDQLPAVFITILIRLPSHSRIPVQHYLPYIHFRFSIVTRNHIPGFLDSILEFLFRVTSDFLSVCGGFLFPGGDWLNCFWK